MLGRPRHYHSSGAHVHFCIALILVIIITISITLFAKGPSNTRAASKPNGRREPYRCSADLPSPVHTSDSEDTYANKFRWQVLTRWVVRRWRQFVMRCKTWRMAKALRLLPNKLPKDVTREIIKFLK